MIFLSLVGRQPAAIATALETWVKHEAPPREIHLLATPQTEAFATRLEAFASSLPQLSESRCRIERISPGLTEDDALPPPHEHCRTLAGERVVFYADPGLNFHVAAVARTLPPETIFLHADSEKLYRCTLTRHDRSLSPHSSPRRASWPERSSMRGSTSPTWRRSTPGCSISSSVSSPST